MDVELIDLAASARRVVAGIEARARELALDAPVAEQLAALFATAPDAEKSYADANAYLAESERASKSGFDYRDFYSKDPAGVALYRKRAAETSLDFPSAMCWRVSPYVGTEAHHRPPPSGGHVGT